MCIRDRAIAVNEFDGGQPHAAAAFELEGGAPDGGVDQGHALFEVDCFQHGLFLGHEDEPLVRPLSDFHALVVCHHHRKGQAAAIHFNELGLAGDGPVSYTHLDVYKRQVQTPAACPL